MAGDAGVEGDVGLSEWDGEVRLGYCTVSGAVFESPPRDAVMVTVCVVETLTVLMVNVALVCPDGMVSTAGTCAVNGLSVWRSTGRPPDGAGAERVTVPFELEPPLTMLELRVRFVGDGRPEGLMVSRTVFLTPPYDPVMATVVEELTLAVATVNVAEDWPAAILTDAGTVARAESVD